MQGLFGAIARLSVMGLVMAAVILGAVFAGLAATTAFALGIVGAGVVGLVAVARKPRSGKLSAHEEIAAMMAPPAPAPALDTRPSIGTAIDAMAPQLDGPINPEAGMPRWRRPSLLEARHADYRATAARQPMLFGEGTTEADVRVVRYAMVPVLDRPDEVLGLQQGDLASGDEVQVVGMSGAFLEVRCPNGDQGWVHRTTLGQRGAPGLAASVRQAMGRDADDALTALLTARGLI
jgi:hypothetical protein